MGYDNTCNNLNEQNTEEYWKTGIMCPISNIHVSCMLFITGGIPFMPGVVSIFSVYITQLKSYRCNSFVHCIHHYNEEDPLSDDNGEPVYYQYNFGFQIFSGAQA